ncbi:MAG: FixH family protein [Proteobacteria bacterium]|nr:FixH family protein [Pseudomonadota bacterium]
MSAIRQDHFVLRGWHVLASLIAFFGAVIAVNVYFAFAAVGTFPGEDVTHPYIQGLEYNRTLAEHRAQQAQGWRVTAAFTHASAGAAVEVVLHQRNGEPLAGAHLEGVLRWPADAHHDRALRFVEQGGGRYVATLSDLTEGDWDLRATATAADRHTLDFEADLRWPLPR